MAHYAIDRFEGSLAVLVGDDGRTFDVPRSELPRGSREGTVLRVNGDPPDWSGAVVDDAERERRLHQAGDTLRRLGEKDTGGDITL
jgi:hypothetical protein